MISRLFCIIILLLSSLYGKAQLCQGSLGDPIVNITFGSGANPGPPLAAAATGYQFISSDCPNDGFYTVRTNTNSCYGNSWHNLVTDHTGNGNGYFMLVNAAFQPSAFYVDTVRGLCGNSTYEFAAWVMNVGLPPTCNGSSIQPNLTFRIEKTDGTIIQTYNSGNIVPTGSPVWKQFGFFFTTPPTGTDIVLRIVNNAPGGCGNDLALDDITFRPCGPQITPVITGQANRTVNICAGQAASFDFTATISGGFTNPDFQWQKRFNNGAWTDIPAANSTTYTAIFLPGDAIGNYEYRLSVAEAGNLASPQCRISSVPLNVIINANPTITVENDGPVCEGGSITLKATGGSQYMWSGPSGYSANAAVVTLNVVNLASSGIYNVIVTNMASCSSQGNTTVQVKAAPIAMVLFNDTAVCIGIAVMLTASGGSAFEWSPVTGLSSTTVSNPFASPAVTTRYTVKVRNADQCTDTSFVNVRVYEKAVPNAGPDRTIISGGSAVLSGTISGVFQSFNWTPTTFLDNPQSLQPIASPTVDAQYVLTAISNNDCGTLTDTALVKIYKGVFIPNAFTPNGDGLNDTWSVPALDAYPDFELFIYNRYGEVVFKNSKSNKPWDGRFKGELLPIGAYPYLIKLNSPNQLFKGTIMLIR